MGHVKGAVSQFRDYFVIALFTLWLALWPFFLVLSHRGVAPALLVMGAAVALSPDIWRQGIKTFLWKPNWRSPLVRAGIFFLLFCAWIALSGLWSPEHDALKANAFSLALNPLTPVLAGGAVIWTIGRWSLPRARWFRGLFAGAASFAIAGLFFEAMTGGLLRDLTPPTQADPARDFVSLGRAATLAIITLLPALALVYGTLRPAGGILYKAKIPILSALFFMTLFAGWRFGISSNVLAVLFSLLMFLWVRRAPQTGLTLLAWGMVAATLLAPAAAFLPAQEWFNAWGGKASVSWLQRLVIWQHAGEAAMGCFTFGCGADYARIIHSAKETFTTPHWPVPLPVMPLHPHNLFLQIWLEMGLIGAALFAAAILNAAKAVSDSALDGATKAVIAASAAAFFVSASFEMSLWQVWRSAGPAYAGVMVALLWRSRRAG